ncbi:MAG: phage holin family protein [Chloroflexi bacterium]|nr:phage holin family protein [Chloroflexota bacterium]
MDDQQDDRSLGQLFGDLSRQLGTLVSKEIQLAKTEITTRVTTVGRDAAMIGAGGALAYAALLMALIAVGLLLIQLGITPWLAFLLVAIIVGAIAAVLIMRGRDELQKTDLAPTKTIETLKEDAEWAKEQVK